MKRVIASALCATVLAVGSHSASAAEGAPLPEYHWSFDGIFGHFDLAAAQRGLQVYREVCAGCHSLRFVAFRDLAALGYDEEQIKAFAAEATVTDGPNEDGDMFERAGLPSDRFPSPFANAKAAAAANGGAAPPDLSLMAKARPGGPSYIRALLTGYEEAPSAEFLNAYKEQHNGEEFELLDGQNFNLYFPGNKIAMAAPLFEDGVTYQDGTPATVEQMAADVSQFLMWAAEPKLEQRKKTGLKVILFLLVLTGVLYAVKRKVWADLH
jgi:ubiquinol-cytochrome c reductase cytochrome c1 subunit